MVGITAAMGGTEVCEAAHPASATEPQSEDETISSSPKVNRVTQVGADQRLIDGLTTHSASIGPLFVNGVQTSGGAAITTLQARVAKAKAVEPAKAAFTQAVADHRTEVADSKAYVTGLRQALRAMFATQPAVLADLGIPPKKVPAPRTIAEKEAANKRAEATRALRHTTGPKAKAKLQAPPVPVEPVEPAAAPTTPAAGTPKTGS